MLEYLLQELPIFSTADEVAEVLATPRHVVQRWLRAGTLPGWRLKSGWVILTVELRQHLQQGRVDAPEPAASAAGVDELLGQALSGLPTHLSVREVADLFDIASTTAYSWLTHGHMPGYRLPGGWVVLREEVIEYLTARREQRPARRDVLAELYEQAPTKLRPGDISTILGISSKSTWSLLRSGHMPAYAIGPDGRYRFALKDEMLQWQRQCSNGALENLGAGQ